MESNKQNQLIDYLLNNFFTSNGVWVKNKQIEELVSKMSADDIIQSIVKARDIQENLKTSPLGRELL
jgi:hypothetical protein